MQFIGTNCAFEPALDADGLPYIGSYLKEGMPLYCCYDEVVGAHTVIKYKKSEPAHVEQVGPRGIDIAVNRIFIRRVREIFDI
tara:strand:- start:772 stop:1020 length:249 start_codon:yes stop_codon:yes gene_type:complete